MRQRPTDSCVRPKQSTTADGGSSYVATGGGARAIRKLAVGDARSVSLDARRPSCRILTKRSNTCWVDCPIRLAANRRPELMAMAALDSRSRANFPGADADPASLGLALPVLRVSRQTCRHKKGDHRDRSSESRRCESTCSLLARLPNSKERFRAEEESAGRASGNSWIGARLFEVESIRHSRCPGQFVIAAGAPNEDEAVAGRRVVATAWLD